MKLSKSDYLSFLECPREFWLRRRTPELFPREENVALTYLKEIGYRVQLQAQTLFSRGDYGECEFEKRFETEQLLAKADIFSGDSIFEVKSSGSVKDEHIHDLAFQKIVAEISGVPVKRTFLVHVNKEYVRRGEIEPENLLQIEDVTERVDAILSETKESIAAAIKYLDTEPDKSLANFCTNKLDCIFIRHFHQDLPEYTIFDINNFRGNGFNQLLEMGILDIMDVPKDFPLTERQRKQVDIAQSGKPYASIEEIKELIDALEFPIYFLDYETANPAIPIYDGYRPFEVIVFQYSIHILDEDGAGLRHFEFLSDGKSDPTRDLLVAMQQVITNEGGTIVIWSAYENTRNRDMGMRCSEFAEYLGSINRRSFDLMSIFSKGHYIDPKFKGSPSIKTVLPVLVPHLNYEHLEIKQGSVASAMWLGMVSDEMSREQRDSIYTGLLEYCALDTQAMTEIMSKLKREFCQ